MKFNYSPHLSLGTLYTRGPLIFSSVTNNLLCAAHNKINAYNITTNTLRTLPFEARSNIKTYALTHDERLLIVIDTNDYATLISYSRGTVLHRFRFKSTVTAISFSPDNKFFAVGCGEHVQVWRTPGVRREFSPFVLHRTLTGFSQGVRTIEWSKDSRYIVAGSSDNTVRIFTVDPIEGFVPCTLAGHKGPVAGAYFLKGGVEEAITISDDGAMCLWVYERGNAGEEGINDDLFSPGKRKRQEESELVGGRWTIKKRHFFSHNQSDSVDGGVKKSKSKSKSKSNSSSSSTSTGQSSKIVSTSTSPDGTLLVVGFENGVFGLYDITHINTPLPGTVPVNCLHTLSVTNGRITAVRVSPDGASLALASPDNSQLLLWDWQSETYLLKQQGHNYGINAVNYSPDSMTMVTGGEDGKVKCWSGAGFCFVTFGVHRGPVSVVKFSKPSVIFSASLDGTIQAYDLVRYKPFRTFTTPTPVQFSSLAIDPSGEIVAGGTLDPFEIYVFSVSNGKIIDVLSGHNGPISCLEFDPVGGMLASGSWDGTVKVWDVYKNQVEETFVHTSDVLSLAWRHDGKFICASTLNGALNFWDKDNGESVGVIDGQRDIVGGRKENDRQTSYNNQSGRHFTSVCYSADGQCVLAGGNSKFVCIYEIASEILLRKFQISHNRSLDGVLDHLNSKYDVEGGEGVIAEIAAEGDDGAPNSNLPGAKRSDDGSRRTKTEVRCKQLSFCSTGREFSVVTTEGLLIYRLDDDMVFDPIALTEAVTPNSVWTALTNQEWSRALTLSLILSEPGLVEEVLDRTPNDCVEIVVRGISKQNLGNLVVALSTTMAYTPHVEFYLNWCLALLKFWGVELSKNGGASGKYTLAFRNLHKVVKNALEDVRKIADENSNRLDLLCQQMTGEP